MYYTSSNASLSSSSEAMILSFLAALLDLVGDLVNSEDASPPKESRLYATVDEAARADDDDNVPPPPGACPHSSDDLPPPANDDTLPPPDACPHTSNDGPAYLR